MSLTPRPAEITEAGAIVALWHNAWHHAHAEIVPPALVAARTLANFAMRSGEFGEGLRVIGDGGTVSGFCVTANDKIDHLFVDPDMLRLGLGARLLADGEARLAASGHRLGRLDCAAANTHACAFYEACGWREASQSVVEIQLETCIVPLPTRHYEKPL